ncbi:MAG: hypothetical protein GKR89_27305 [Candidatus Latescibacteria bacterium]|nr:hypothetical protein [Candidatus Latescibacterota bacterium]
MIEQALRRSRDVLGLVDDPLDAAAASVLFKYALLQLWQDAAGDLPQWRRLLAADPSLGAGLRQALDDLVPVLVTHLEEIVALGGLQAAAADKAGQFLGPGNRYRQRLVELSLEAVLSESLAPEIMLEMGPLTPPPMRSGQYNHAVLFAAAPLFGHEFYPLVADALVRDSARYGQVRFNLWGAHVDWLDHQGDLQRALFLDFDRDAIREGDLAAPLRPDSVQFLCLGRHEQRLHADYSARYTCPQINPHTVAGLADDKAATLELWAASGVPVPPYLKVAPGDWAAVRGFWARQPEMVVKPNRATEGRGVAFFTPSQTAAQQGLEAHLQVCWQEGDALLQARCDEVLYRDPDSGRLHTLALRLNAACNDHGYWLESVCGQLGADAAAPAAAGRGGRLVPVEQLVGRLEQRGVSGSVHLPSAIWPRLAQLTAMAAAVFPGLLLVGLDIVLQVVQDRVEAVFLEANPRPAGLGHAGPVPGGADNPGVSQKLWDGLERLVDKRWGPASHAPQGAGFSYTTSMP